nr:MAG TPA: hypothetical protein [Caudoviricetes sp.]
MSLEIPIIASYMNAVLLHPVNSQQTPPVSFVISIVIFSSMGIHL